MSKLSLINDSEDEENITIRTENEYAKKYDTWREKEEMHKLQQKYGAEVDSHTDSEDESDEPPEFSEEMETKFLKTLALLKTKNERIYDPNFKFFDNEAIKKEDVSNLKKQDNVDDIFGYGTNSIAVKEEKPAQESFSLKDYLKGTVDHIDEDIEEDLAPLKALWSDPKLGEDEAFLRDYILNQRYLDGDEENEENLLRVRDDVDLKVDEALVEEQAKFERAYNFRFEEPDEEYMKRYPRTMNSMRPKSDRRAKKRAEVRTRKEEAKKKKKEEIARLKALKLKEIQAKLDKIKKIVGNEELPIEENDVDGEFDPAEHDKRMKALFDDEYYGGADEEKPVFPELDEELEIENWQNYENENQECEGGARDAAAVNDLHCEDEDFNMDADYDPKQARANLLEEMKRGLTKKKRRNRKNKSKLARLLVQEKPKFVPTYTDKTYAEYMEEYYKMDCEDIIGGDLPTRFKYREVVPNDFGLSIEEILLADDKELTKWAPLSKVVNLVPKDVQRNEVLNYAQKAKDKRLKRAVLPSLFKGLPEEPQIVVPVETSKINKRKKDTKTTLTDEGVDEKNSNIFESNIEENFNNEFKEIPKKKKKNKKTKASFTDTGNDESNFECRGQIDNEVEEIPKKKKKNKKTKASFTDTGNDESNFECRGQIDNEVEEIPKKKKKDKKTKAMLPDTQNYENNLNVCKSSVDDNLDNGLEEIPKKKKNKKSKASLTDTEIDDDNLSVFNKTTVDKSDNEGKETPKKKKKNKDNETNAMLRDTGINENNLINKKEPGNVPITKVESNNVGIIVDVQNVENNSLKREKHEKKINDIEESENIPSRKSKGKNNHQGVAVENMNEQELIDCEKSNQTESNSKSSAKHVKRKAEPTTEENYIPIKKKKNKQNINPFNKMKNFKNSKDKSKDNKSHGTENLMSRLSDERLKDYGLNPKKYRSFIKYKKF